MQSSSTAIKNGINAVDETLITLRNAKMQISSNDNPGNTINPEVNRSLQKLIDELVATYYSYRYDENQDRDKGDFISRLIVESIQLLNEHQLSAQSLAERYKISTYRLRTRLQRKLGISTSGFILAVKMSRARYLLMNRPELNVSDIAERCGYSEEANFIRAFRNYYRLTPNAFIRQNNFKQT